MSLLNQQKNQHLFWRAGFGPAAEQLKDIAIATPHQLYKALEKASSKKPRFINVADNYLQGLYMGIEDAGRQQKRKELTADERKMIQKKKRESIRNLNLAWLGEMIKSSAQLREKMAFFWHGHFACRNLNIFYQQQLLDIIRRHALGNFRDMLHEVSKSAAMINFLNNNQNRKDHPNENFAREVMELFTLGRGNYAEHDIKDAARAFTGWGANVQGEFIFRRFQHDAGSKTVLGNTGNLQGDEVLDILLEQKQTAKFITQKVYRFFVNEVPDETKIEWLADRFYQSNYEISKLMEDIFTSDWFYDLKNIGSIIKSPVELLAGIQRILPMEVQNDEALLLLQRLLGQVLFYPPNVAGWPGGKSWIDSSSLVMRMRIPMLINDVDELNINPKDDDDQMMGRNENTPKLKNNGMGKSGRPIQADINWPAYMAYFESIPKEKLQEAITVLLLQTKTGVNPELIRKYMDSSGRENFIKSATFQLMSTPEYQMC
jgi:uncharacterized protein (DUF1800 family)